MSTEPRPNGNQDPFCAIRHDSLRDDILQEVRGEYEELRRDIHDVLTGAVSRVVVASEAAARNTEKADATVTRSEAIVKESARMVQRYADELTGLGQRLTWEESKNDEQHALLAKHDREIIDLRKMQAAHDLRLDRVDTRSAVSEAQIKAPVVLVMSNKRIGAFVVSMIIAMIGTNNSGAIIAFLKGFLP